MSCMRVVSLANSVAGLVTLTLAVAQAQERDTLGPAQRVGLALARLGAGQRVRVRARPVGFVDGWVVSSSPNLVTIRTQAGSQIEVPAPGVDSLWARHGSHAGTGALIGGAVAGVGLGAVAVGLSGLGERGTDPAAFVPGFLIGGVGGVLIGALIGGTVPKWELRVPSRAEQYR